jgi:hypothetical protein
VNLTPACSTPCPLLADSMAEEPGRETDDIRVDIDGAASPATTNDATLSRCVLQWAFQLH